MFNFEKLETWQKAIALADQVYELTQNFPARESGLRRAVLENA